ncbi:hypothetical protein DPMN_025802 [Dreissena polymorpha]|uniref:Uncharacterized protein n=1 Tax=Dreissena polymorpha TaxID=45954 RepID=A0A9D4LS91_DREPO|nr:hypothetical protein DPMN_025802 [Dreissena polymorpha]
MSLNILFSLLQFNVIASDAGPISKTASARVEVTVWRNLNTPIFQNTASYAQTIAWNAGSLGPVIISQGAISATDADTNDYVCFICVVDSHQVYSS